MTGCRKKCQKQAGYFIFNSRKIYWAVVLNHRYPNPVFKQHNMLSPKEIRKEWFLRRMEKNYLGWGGPSTDRKSVFSGRWIYDYFLHLPQIWKCSKTDFCMAVAHLLINGAMTVFLVDYEHSYCFWQCFVRSWLQKAYAAFKNLYNLENPIYHTSFLCFSAALLVT